MLKTSTEAAVITPTRDPDPSSDQGWCFPDTEQGIVAAIESGATHLWANTVLFASHPLQTSSVLSKYADAVCIIGQPPRLVERFDDKAWLNNLIRAQTTIPMPRAWSVDADQDFNAFLSSERLPFPMVGKPVRGRGSHGVKLCTDTASLEAHVLQLFTESSIVMLEAYLGGEEGTVTILPPSPERPEYWALPLVVRFNHANGIAPYNGVVAVTQNSRAISAVETKKNPAYKDAVAHCEQVARILGCTAPIRIDIRQFSERSDSSFALFDINMKPVSITTLFIVVCIKIPV